MGIRKGTSVLLATKKLRTKRGKMKFTVVALLLALVACHQANGKARFGSVEGKAKGTSPRSIYEKTMMMDDDSEKGCNCNDTGCDCPEGLDACCRMGFCCGEDYPIFLPRSVVQLIILFVQMEIRATHINHKHESR